jgi:hypothetical protein
MHGRMNAAARPADLRSGPKRTMLSIVLPPRAAVH